MLSAKTLISFDYAIKYLLRNKGGYDIIEGFISALLATEGYSPVKINAVLESEPRRGPIELQRSIADLVMEDKQGNKYIIEIERSLTPYLMHSACVKKSRLVIDSITGNQNYTTIEKVFHINLLYFWDQEVLKSLCPDKAIIHEIDTSHPVDFRVVNQGLISFKQKPIFPEYFFISIPSFNDIIHQEIDEWLYMMKHAEIKADFKSPHMEKVQECLAVLKMSDAERVDYYRYLKEAVYAQDALMTAEQEGFKKGMEEVQKERLMEGKREETIAIAKALLQQGLSPESIQQATGLSAKEIMSL